MDDTPIFCLTNNPSRHCLRAITQLVDNGTIQSNDNERNSIMPLRPLTAVSRTSFNTMNITILSNLGIVSMGIGLIIMYKEQHSFAKRPYHFGFSVRPNAQRRLDRGEMGHMEFSGNGILTLGCNLAEFVLRALANGRQNGKKRELHRFHVSRNFISFVKSFRYVKHYCFGDLKVTSTTTFQFV